MLWKVFESRLLDCLDFFFFLDMFVIDVFNEGMIFAVSALTISASPPSSDEAPVCLSFAIAAAADSF